MKTVIRQYKATQTIEGSWDSKRLLQLFRELELSAIDSQIRARRVFLLRSWAIVLTALGVIAGPALGYWLQSWRTGLLIAASPWPLLVIALILHKTVTSFTTPADIRFLLRPVIRILRHDADPGKPLHLRLSAKPYTSYPAAAKATWKVPFANLRIPLRDGSVGTLDIEYTYTSAPGSLGENWRKIATLTATWIPGRSVRWKPKKEVTVFSDPSGRSCAQAVYTAEYKDIGKPPRDFPKAADAIRLFVNLARSRRL